METTGRIAVTDTSPIIALVSAGVLQVLDELFAQVFVPMSVWQELTVYPKSAEPAALAGLAAFRLVVDVAEVPPLAGTLGPGERQAIAVALAKGALVLLDDGPARAAARRLHVAHVGAIGIVAAATERKLLPVARPVLQHLVTEGFRVDLQLVNDVLTDLGEEPISGG